MYKYRSSGQIFKWATKSNSQPHKPGPFLLRPYLTTHTKLSKWIYASPTDIPLWYFVFTLECSLKSWFCLWNVSSLNLSCCHSFSWSSRFQLNYKDKSNAFRLLSFHFKLSTITTYVLLSISLSELWLCILYHLKYTICINFLCCDTCKEE